ncbi:uncharacterized protein LOC123519814 [Portunus trituberculatus]|uniref:uncharacterized protein LOC123519814 n=1 Tax=Portunus trituberculatus TaxID=210409 RepID=UPI001E1CECB9|nr:uncharacterized protein LOC123519814 [Portunus trituberculatus]XP_045137267.1 uncharacterized protein LOC123519814 [Portunus trituberculatus]
MEARTSYLLLFLLLTQAPQGEGLSILETIIPVYKIRGENAELYCHYDVEGEVLYSVKWYKDDEEFYRYMPGTSSSLSTTSPQSIFPRPGIYVDSSKSNASRVVLTDLDFRTSGLYRCEVSVENTFNTLNRFGRMLVVELPTSEPQIGGVRDKYVSGEVLEANCTAGRSHPAATLTWHVNNKEVPRKYTHAYAPVLHVDQLETSILGLRLLLEDHHFTDGVILLRCTATVAALDTRSDQDFLQMESRPVEPLVLAQRNSQVYVNGCGGLGACSLFLLLGSCVVGPAARWAVLAD